MADNKSMQTNIKQMTSNAINDYSIFLGGLNTTHQALEQYDPLRTGYGRIFFVKMPRFMEVLMPEASKRVKHIMEYGNTGVSGISNTTLDFEQFTGGYAGKSFDIPTVAKDETNEITLSLYEFAGSPIREYMDMWISGISDLNTGLQTFHNAKIAKTDGSGYKRLEVKQSNAVAEAFYVHTGPSGRADDIEFACFLTNMMPKQATKDHFEYSAGEHKIVQISQTFTCVKYESPQINEVAKALINKYIIIRDFLDFKSGWTNADVNNDAIMAPVNIKDWNYDIIKNNDYTDNPNK